MGGRPGLQCALCSMSVELQCTNLLVLRCNNRCRRRGRKEERGEKKEQERKEEESECIKKREGKVEGGGMGGERWRGEEVEEERRGMVMEREDGRQRQTPPAPLPLTRGLSPSTGSSSE